MKADQTARRDSDPSADAMSKRRQVRSGRYQIVRSIAVVSVAVAIVLLTLVPTSGQWLKYPTPGIPRTPDGKPDVSAPAPRTADGKPDLSGIWQPNAGGYQFNITADLNPGEFRPWAAALTKERFGRESPTTLCLPPGPGLRAMIPMVKVIQTPGPIVMLYETPSQDRQIFMDGRALPDDPNPTWMGYSVGHWDGDTLVVESAGFNDKTWLDSVGHPHSEELRITERFTRRDFARMQLEMTIDDPRAYTRRFTVPVDLQYVADTELLERVCNESERDVARPTGVMMSAITMASSVLSTFVGTYEVTAGTAYVVTLAGDQLMLQRPRDKVRSPLVPIADTNFVHIGSGSAIEFIKDAQGAVIQLIVRIVEGETRAVRRSQ
jgi:hypothetical protein